MQSSAAHILIALLLLAVLVFLNTTGTLGGFIDIGRKSAGFLSQPIAAIFKPIKNLTEVATSIGGLSRENDILTAQVAELTADLATFEKFRVENNRLREALGFVSDTNFTLLPAEVITLDPLSQSQRVIINLGRKHGVRQGDAVVVADKVLVGVISSVLEQTSEMELITSSEITINAQSSSGEATGVVRGEHGLGLLFDLVSQNEVVNVGDKLLTSGLGGQFPKNLLIGEISDIRSASSELFQKATVLPAVNLRGLDIIFVLKQ